MTRLDVWLDVACLFKTRSEAQRACRLGKVTIGGVPAKSHREVRVGDELVIARPLGRRQSVTVLGVIDAHVPKAEARLLYREYSRVGPCDQSVYMQRQDGFLQFHALPEYRLLMGFLKPEVTQETESKLQRLSAAIKQLDLPTFSEFLNSDRPWGAGDHQPEEEATEGEVVIVDDKPDEHEAKKARGVLEELE